MEILDQIEARIICSHEDQISINVRHYQVLTKVGTGADLAACALAIDTEIVAEIKALLPDTVTYRGVGCRRIFPLPLTPEIPYTGTTAVGTVLGDVLPGQVSGILTLRTAFAGKRYRGRFYMGFPGEADNTASGIPSLSYVGRLAALGNKLDNVVTAGGGGNTNTLQPYVRSKKFGLQNAITITQARQRWATQRRRGNYGVPNIAPW